MPIDLYPNIAKVKRGGVYQNLPGFVQASSDADIKAMIANSESSTTAQYAHPEGSYFILNDVLYKAIIDIAVNDTIAVGTNCIVAVLGNDVTNIKNDLDEQSVMIDELLTPETKTGTIMRFEGASKLVSDDYTGNITVYGKNIVAPLNYGTSPYIDNYSYTSQGMSITLIKQGRFGMKRSSNGTGNVRIGLFTTSYNSNIVLPAGKYTATLFNLGIYDDEATITPNGDIKLYVDGSYKTSIYVESSITKNSYEFTSDGTTPTTIYLQIASSVIVNNIIGVQIEYAENASAEYEDVSKSLISVATGDTVEVGTDIVTIVSGTLLSTNGSMTITGYSFDLPDKIDELDERIDIVEETIAGMQVKKLSIPWIICSHSGRTSDSDGRNTLEAFNNAWLDGATQIEMDARLTSDGKYVVHHNDTVIISGITYIISEMTQEAVSALIVHTDSKYGDWKIPTLEDALKFCCYAGMSVNLDCKNVNATTLAETVVANGMSGKVTYANIDDSYADDILAIDPLASFCFMYSSENITKWVTALSNIINRSKSVALSNSPSSEMVSEIKANGFMFGLGVITGSTANMDYYPDMVLYEYNVNMTNVNQDWLDNISFFDN